MYELQSSPTPTSTTGKRPSAPPPSVVASFPAYINPWSLQASCPIIKNIMNVYIIALAMMASMASATWPVVVVGGTTTVAVSSGAAVLLGAKLLAAKGLLLGAALSRRGRRETISETFLEASKKDQYDCAKMLICELNAKPIHTLEVRKRFA